MNISVLAGIQDKGENAMFLRECSESCGFRLQILHKFTAC